MDRRQSKALLRLKPKEGSIYRRSEARSNPHRQSISAPKLYRKLPQFHLSPLSSVSSQTHLAVWPSPGRPLRRGQPKFFDSLGSSPLSTVYCLLKLLSLTCL